MGLSRKWKWILSGGSLIIVGIILIVLGVVIPKNIQDDIESRTKESGIMNQQNKKFWIATPPPAQADQDPTFFIRDFQFINALNTNNAGLVRPQFQELFPLQFEQNISFSQNLASTSSIMIPSQYGSSSYPGYQFQQDIRLATDSTISKKAQISVPNKGALSVWNWLKNAPQSRQALYGLYSVFNDSIEEYIDYAVFNIYLDKEYSEDKRYSNFTKFKQAYLGQFESYQQENIWNDPVFGVSNLNNIKYWKISFTDSNLGNQVKRDMMLSFGINSLDKFTTLQNQVKKDINNARTNLNKQAKCVPYSGSGECDKYDYGYAQWSQSSLSLLISNNTKLCLDQVNPTWIHGHFSMNAYLNKTIFPKYSTQYPSQFNDTVLNFRPYTNAKGDFNYFYLFNTNLVADSLFPEQTSLFNLQSLQMLIDSFKNYKEVSKIQQQKKMLDLTQFQKIADRLQLTKEQAFVIAYYIVNELIPNIWMNKNKLGSQVDIAYISRWAPQALQEGVLLSYMTVLPRALYAYGLYNIYVDDFNLTCQQILTRLINSNQINQDKTDVICQNTDWNFQQGASWYKWISIYIQGKDSIIANELYTLGNINITSSALANFFDQTKEFYSIFTSIEQTLNIYYGQSVCGGQQWRKACPDSNLAIEQLLNQSITSNIPSFIQRGITLSKSIFTTFANLTAVLEPSYLKQFQYSAGGSAVDVNLAKQALFVMPHWNNFTFFENYFAKTSASEAEQSTRELIRQVIAMQKLGGFFVTVSQNDLLNLYGNQTIFSKTVSDYQSKSLYDYGIPQLQDKKYSIASMFQQGNGQSNKVFSGSQDKMELIRVFRENAGEQSIKQIKENILTNQTITLNLWAQNVDFYFTDGFQVTSGVSSGDSLEVYFPELRRPVTISYHKGRTLHDLQVVGLHLDQDWVDKQKETAIYYNNMINSGISFNITEEWGAQTIVTKSRFLHFNDANYIPILKDFNGAVVKPDSDLDDVEIWAQKNSGISVYYNTNLMYNFVMGGDALCYSKQGPYLAPFVTIKSNMQYSKDLINDRFPDVAKDQQKRNIVRYVLLVIGIIILLVGVAFVIRAIFIKEKRPDMEDDEAMEEIIV